MRSAMRRHLSALLGVTALAAVNLAAPDPARAQDVPDVRTPGRDQLKQPDVGPPPQSTATVRSDGAFARGPCPFTDPALTISFDRVRYEMVPEADGSVPPVPAELAALLARVDEPTGTQPLSAVCDIRDMANAALRGAHYVASVVIPPQRVEGGELRMQLVVARIVEVRVRGDAGPYRDVLEARIAQLKQLNPLNERDAEQILLLASDIPGLTVDLSLSPAGGRAGDVIGDLNIGYRPFSLFANAQNYNSRQLGRETGYLRAEYYGLTGMSDVTYVGASSTADFKEQVIVQGGHIMGLTADGLTLGVRGTYAWSRPDLGLLDLETRSLVAGFDLRQPLERSLLGNAAAAIGFDYIEQRTRSATSTQSVLINRDKLRVAFARLDADMRSRQSIGDSGGVAWELRGDVELRKGLGIFDATPRDIIGSGSTVQPTRIDGNSRAWVIRADLEGAIGLGPVFSLYGRAEGQWADDPLLNFEEYSIGSLTIGRGYDPGANSGDRALGLRGEARAQLWRADGGSGRWGVEAFGFYDQVFLDNLDRGSSETDRGLASVGGGVRVRVLGLALLEMMYARPLDRALTIDDRKPADRLLVSLTVLYSPGAR